MKRRPEWRADQTAGVLGAFDGGEAACHRAYLRTTHRALLEALELAFHYLGGLFSRLHYGNLSSAATRYCGARSENHWLASSPSIRSGSLGPTSARGESYEKSGVKVKWLILPSLVSVPVLRILRT